MIHGRSFKKRAPHAIKSIKDFALKHMGTKDVRIDPALNKSLWSTGIRNVPRRIRVRFARRRNDSAADETSTSNNLYTYVTYVPTANFKGLQTVTIEE